VGGRIPGDRRADRVAPVVVVLAAGASRRFGGGPKALLKVDGQPAVRRILEVARSIGIREAVVVVGPHRDPIAEALRGDPAEVVTNVDWERGRTGSLQVGLRSVATGASVLLWPVDHPFAEANTVRALGTAADRDPVAPWIMPTYEGRGGHPVWLAPPAIRLVDELAPDAPLRSLIPRLGVQVLRLPTQDPWIRVGTDTPAEYADAIARRVRRA
jgi:CTP:molybdopterin cytidylyltransferase MocA